MIPSMHLITTSLEMPNENRIASIGEGEGGGASMLFKAEQARRVVGQVSFSCGRWELFAARSVHLPRRHSIAWTESAQVDEPFRLFFADPSVHPCPVVILARKRNRQHAAFSGQRQLAV
jgi:hypothetical protein